MTGILEYDLLQEKLKLNTLKLDLTSSSFGLLAILEFHSLP